MMDHLVDSSVGVLLPRPSRFVALEDIRFGDHDVRCAQKGQGRIGPARPNIPRLGARVAPQRCPILRGEIRVYRAFRSLWV